MNKYEIFAGVTNGDDPPSHGIYEFRNEQEANVYAYQLAVEDYQSYEGYHGILDWDECKEDLQESGMLDGLAEDEIEECVNTHYLENIESWVTYYAVLVK